MWTTLNSEGRSETKIWACNICEKSLYIEFKRDWSVGSGPTLGDEIFFQFQGFFSGRADSVILLGYECTINPQNLMVIIFGAIFEKEKI